MVFWLSLMRVVARPFSAGVPIASMSDFRPLVLPYAPLSHSEGYVVKQET